MPEERVHGRLILFALTIVVAVALIFAFPATNLLLHQTFGPELRVVELGLASVGQGVTGAVGVAVGGPIDPRQAAKDAGQFVGGTEYKEAVGVSGGASTGVSGVGGGTSKLLGGK